MHVSGITTSVAFADLLAVGLERWRDGLDSLLVVTSPEDEDTQELCARSGVRLLVTGSFHADGATFNKAAALEDGLAFADPSDWCLLFDADVVPPRDWRATLEAAKPCWGSLHGASRLDDEGRAIGDGELAGFFQLWHIDDPVAQERPLFGSWSNASGYDSTFAARWLPERQVVLPLTLQHLGPPGRNWCGRGRPEFMAKLWKERQLRRGWAHEMLRAPGVMA